MLKGVCLIVSSQKKFSKKDSIVRFTLRERLHLYNKRKHQRSKILVLMICSSSANPMTQRLIIKVGYLFIQNKKKRKKRRMRNKRKRGTSGRCSSDSSMGRIQGYCANGCFLLHFTPTLVPTLLHIAQ